MIKILNIFFVKPLRSPNDDVVSVFLNLNKLVYVLFKNHIPTKIELSYPLNLWAGLSDSVTSSLCNVPQYDQNKANG